ncbi:nicotinate-nucleotide--dimethylbenzimidazole phosphoribosyltransferase [Bacillus sp. PK3_68]|uniref:nicotinate-nucleotide--dimethylbenzimidazole phosphoribosyltransferase n=1 Tax=Bacillaceae TaxID=186817 RepID=UPI000E7458F3|nr:nicotinate-nucleotide--dimethylbenzimidazole phosphoribosyltransferase [Bacillus sp. PK3_68]RJS59089.1 nicotinate-nucleotide--dimethylbenzimidazole phosphoribosyltransferase [Bacillus sp. PK3_68]
MKKFEIPSLNEEMGRQVSDYINTLTKPIGSLGRLEDLAIELAKITGKPFPEVLPPGVIVFAADHGIVQEGVSAFPQEVTAQMVENMVNGGAAINVFSRQIGAQFKVVDVGVAADVVDEGVIHKKVRRGTASFLNEAAMTREEAIQALSVGYEEAKGFIETGMKCLIVGEVGIGNTTASSAVLACLTGIKPEEIVGQGTGISKEQLERKIKVVKQAIDRRQPDPQDAIDLVANIGGLEMAAMAGAMLAAAERRIPILLDGFICTVSACIAHLLAPVSSDYMIVSHQSAEPGHSVAVQYLKKRPILQLGMRLGEGSGAAVAFPILEAAVNMTAEMATFAKANVSNKTAASITINK